MVSQLFLVGILFLEGYPILRGLLLAVAGVGTWIVGLGVAYLLYKKYAA